MAKWLRAYGDREGDGMVQMTFTLAILPGDRAKEAAKRFAEAHGLKDPLVTTMEQCSQQHTYFVAYGHSAHQIDIDTIDVAELAAKPLDREQIEAMGKNLGRKIVVVGACTGSDAHTVGIDAILNYKGFAGEKGLESYKCFDAHNLGAQVENVELAERAKALGADAILVSQVITQRNCHKENAAALVDLLKKQGVRDKFLLLLGGPRIDNKLALELGYEGGFGPGTKPSTVAAFVAEEILRRARGTQVDPRR
ncbi:OAM dimerization domain-containing protein [Polyangium sp. 6x1]|uniref:lysine 5,6-aminomutase subunit beta n=1 Tax=Polyangium sp. 6x1 TaxID=3042689 RepID=UPI002482F4AB|nr:OAM dimerization domain-containing protein [Polyangium sp. 6x1]MDI1446899.1 OAM dimerization domain-containing protein [Polyangium sp. 6x1]